MEETKLDYNPQYENLYVENCVCGEIVEVIGYQGLHYFLDIRVRCSNCGEFVKISIEVE